jgi:dUTP pyrophosphatase
MNSVGVIDSDFYNNPDNEGHFQVKLLNLGENDFEVKVGDKIAQGVFMKYLTVDDEEEIKSKRKSGLGSTGK